MCGRGSPLENSLNQTVSPLSVCLLQYPYVCLHICLDVWMCLRFVGGFQRGVTLVVGRLRALRVTDTSSSRTDRYREDDRWNDVRSRFAELLARQASAHVWQM